MNEQILDWLRAEERRAFKFGRSLTKQELAIADRLKIDEPVYVFEGDIELPPEIKKLCASFGLSDFAGFTADHGILAKRKGIDLIVHELVHVAQQERYDHLSDFVTEYLRQCVEHGYPDAPFEIEARGFQQYYK